MISTQAAGFGTAVRLAEMQWRFHFLSLSAIRARLKTSAFLVGVQSPSQ
jgi:hypothetical protein